MEKLQTGKTYHLREIPANSWIKNNASKSYFICPNRPLSGRPLMALVVDINGHYKEISMSAKVVLESLDSDTKNTEEKAPAPASPRIYKIS